MQEITSVTKADIGRVAVSENGYFRVKILVGRGDSSTVEFLKETGSYTKGEKVQGFGLIEGSEKMYWEDTNN